MTHTNNCKKKNTYYGGNILTVGIQQSVLITNRKERVIQRSI